MIHKINSNISNSNQNKYPKNEPSFGDGGIGQFILSGIQLCETQPMVNVAVADLATAIVPRTIIEGQTNPYAGVEAFRRESSGLIINCIIPSFIVLGVAKVLQSSIMGKGSEMASCWANEDTINMVTKYWNNADGKTDRAKVEDTIRKILTETSGVDGTETKSFKDLITSKDLEEHVKKLTDNVFNEKVDKKALKNVYKSIVDKTHIAENIKIKGHGDGAFSQNLSEVVESVPRLLRDLVHGKIQNADSFAAKAKRLLTTKSLGGLAIILSLAISAQPINRWLTERSSGKKGAPIYKDFEHAQSKELSAKEKSALFRQKLISVSSMVGVALLSIMKMPSWGMLKNISQFKSIFPSMDQARLIATTTFASRMMASQDRNDLREATFRDIATFCTFYFIGDYVAKGVATIMDKTKRFKNGGIKLVNVLEKTPEGAGPLKKFWYWAKHTSLKSTAEAYGKTAEATKYAKNMRSVCQLVNLGFQLITLGIIIPKMYRKKTEKEHEKELKKMEMDKKAAKTDKK